jgi:hypothetical protein
VALEQSADAVPVQVEQESACTETTEEKSTLLLHAVHWPGFPVTYVWYPVLQVAAEQSSAAADAHAVHTMTEAEPEKS